MVGSKKRDASREKKQPVCNVRVVKCVDEGFPVHAQTQEPSRIQLADGSLSALALLSLAGGSLPLTAPRSAFYPPDNLPHFSHLLCLNGDLRS